MNGIKNHNNDYCCVLIHIHCLLFLPCHRYTNKKCNSRTLALFKQVSFLILQYHPFHVDWDASYRIGFCFWKNHCYVVWITPLEGMVLKSIDEGSCYCSTNHCAWVRVMVNWLILKLIFWSSGTSFPKNSRENIFLLNNVATAFQDQYYLSQARQ